MLTFYILEFKTVNTETNDYTKCRKDIGSDSSDPSIYSFKIQLTHHNMIIKDKTNDKTKSTDI